VAHPTFEHALQDLCEGVATMPPTNTHGRDRKISNYHPFSQVHIKECAFNL
jgi:hypothetical protein